jgi:acyl carrier protein
MNALTRSAIENGLYSALAESRGMTPSDVRTAVGEGGEIDSLEGVELVAAAEERFGVRIGDDELSARVCASIPRLTELVYAKVSAGATDGG